MRAGGTSSPLCSPLLYVSALLFMFGSSCGRQDCPQPTPRAIVDAGIGEPCNISSNCAAGLDCRALFPVPELAGLVFTANACTQSCGAGCPVGNKCQSFSMQQRDGGTSAIEVCLPACRDDSECRVGLSAGTCKAGTCERLRCTADAQCPAGFACEIPAIVCCPAGARCGFSGPVPGYCRRS